MLTKLARKPPTMIETALIEQGISQFTQRIPDSLIHSWVYRLNSAINSSSNNANRHYVDAQKLYQLNILQELFSPAFVNMINKIIPNAWLYHCHVYEIKGSQQQSHIHADNHLQGWHVDEDCLFAASKNECVFMSYFLYLTDVGEDNGGFEIAPVNCFEHINNTTKSRKILGKAGTQFLFNRTFWHRATPNVNPKPRMVLKLSFQSKAYASPFIESDGAMAISKSNWVKKSPIIKGWFSGEFL